MRLPAAPLFDRPANGLDEDEPLETPCERREPGFAKLRRPSPPNPLLLGAALPLLSLFSLRAPPNPPLEELRDPPLDAAPPKPLPRDPSLDSPKLPLANGFLFLSLPKGLPPVGLALLPKFFSELEL